MQRSLVRNEKQALIYLTDCLLATVSDMAMKKSRKKYEYERHIEIAQTAVNWLKDFGCSIENDSRADKVLLKPSQTVKEWAKDYEPLTEFVLHFCEKCFQMTNHIGNECQKCKNKTSENAEKELRVRLDEGQLLFIEQCKRNGMPGCSITVNNQQMWVSFTNEH